MPGQLLLVRAVKLERSVGIPAVVIADDLAIPDEVWLHRFANGLLQTPILHFRDRNPPQHCKIWAMRRSRIRHPTLFDLQASEAAGQPNTTHPFSLAGIFLGTSSFTAKGWQGSFYPQGMRSRDFLSFYASQFQTVEIDSTFYGTPRASTVASWNEKTPGDFIFAAKVITHEKVLVDCDSEFQEFVKTMDILGPKLGPMVFQFPSFDRWKFPKQGSFLAVLTPFLKKLPADHKFVIEIRNKNWLDARLADVFRDHKIALALTDTSFLPRPWELKEKVDLVTADFGYERWLGDRHGIEKVTRVWDKTVVDRKDDLTNWVTVLKELVLNKKIRKLFAFANNHYAALYAGHGPATVKQFWDLWTKG